MPSSPEPEGPTLAEKVAAAMSEAAEVTKSSRNTEQGYNFASAEAVLAAVRAPLLARGVLLIPSEGQYEAEEITSRSGTKGQRVTVTMRFRFTDGRDELTLSGWRGVGQDFGDKAAGKAYTNALKTLIRTAWLLPTEHDDPERSSPGENVGTQGPAELPGWALTTMRGAEWGEALIPLIGRERAAHAWRAIGDSLGGVPDLAVVVAKLLAAMFAEARSQRRPGGTETLGGGTRTVAQAGGHQTGTGTTTITAGGSANAVGHGGSGAEAPAPVMQTAAGPTIPGAAADGVTDDTAAFRAAANPEPPGDGGGVTLEEARRLADKPAPGTVNAPENLSADPAKATAELKAAGCSCPSPIAAERQRATGELPAAEDVDKGCAIHGIPF